MMNYQRISIVNNIMSDLGETFKAYKQDRKAKKETNLLQSLQLLDKHHVSYKILSSNNGHVRIGDRVDFWCSTGTWYDRYKKRKGRGVFNLIKYLNAFTDL